jgi:hypothetical protein
METEFEILCYASIPSFEMEGKVSIVMDFLTGFRT